MSSVTQKINHKMVVAVKEKKEVLIPKPNPWRKGQLLLTVTRKAIFSFLPPPLLALFQNFTSHK